MSTGKSPSWKRVLGVLSDATSEQRAKVQEALQQTLRDGSLHPIPCVGKEFGLTC